MDIETMTRDAATERMQRGTVSNYSRPSQRRSLPDARSTALVRGNASRLTMRSSTVNGEEGTNGDTFDFEGYASVTESPYQMWDMFGPYDEIIRSGAFGPTLARGADVAFLLNHGGMTLARTKSGTLQLSEDDNGLLTTAQLLRKQTIVNDIKLGMDRGDLDEMSFAFSIVRGVWSPDWTQYYIDEVEMNKGDVSIVNYGANPATAGASMRSKDILEGLGTLNLESLQLARQRIADRESALSRGQLDSPESTVASWSAVDLDVELLALEARRH